MLRWCQVHHPILLQRSHSWNEKQCDAVRWYSAHAIQLYRTILYRTILQCTVLMIGARIPSRDCSVTSFLFSRQLMHVWNQTTHTSSPLSCLLPSLWWLLPAPITLTRSNHLDYIISTSPLLSFHCQLGCSTSPHTSFSPPLLFSSLLLSFSDTQGAAYSEGPCQWTPSQRGPWTTAPLSNLSPYLCQEVML